MNVSENAIFPEVIPLRGRAGARAAAQAYMTWRTTQIRDCAGMLARSSLENLSLSNTRLGEVFINSFSHDLLATSTLKEINFSENYISVEDAANFIIQSNAKGLDFHVNFENNNREYRGRGRNREYIGYDQNDINAAIVAQLVDGIDFRA